MTLRHGSLFSGIGGFDLAAEWCGWKNVFHCEWNDFGQKVLKHYWPEAESYGDITKTDFTKWRGSVDVISGGFPCQPYSTAGKRLGKEDERHLWPHMLRAIQEIQPRWVVGENVLGLVNWDDGLVFQEVCANLEAQGYEVQPFVLPAASKGAPHSRQRVWFVAYANGSRLERCADRRIQRNKRGGDNLQNGFTSRNGNEGNATDSKCDGLEHSTKPTELRQGQGETWSGFARHFKAESWARFPTQPPICGGDDGLPTELDGITFSKWRGESIKAYGNAIVPQVAYQIFKSIQQTIK